VAEEVIRIDAVMIGGNLVLVDQSSVDMGTTMEAAALTTTTLILTATGGVMVVVAEESLIILMGEAPDGMEMATAIATPTMYRIAIVGCLLAAWAEGAGLRRDRGMHALASIDSLRFSMIICTLERS
jgi:hypothetical protein